MKGTYIGCVIPDKFSQSMDSFLNQKKRKPLGPWFPLSEISEKLLFNERTLWIQDAKDFLDEFKKFSGLNYRPLPTTFSQWEYHIEFWWAISSPKHILLKIFNGLEIKFSETPQPWYIKSKPLKPKDFQEISARIEKSVEKK